MVVSPTGGMAGKPISVYASLTDVSAGPPLPIANASISFTLGRQICDGVTASGGFASCTLTPQATGLSSLAAAFQATGEYQAAAASTAFAVIGPPEFIDSQLSAKVEIDGHPPTTFQVNGSFTLAIGGNGIDPVSQPVVLQIGTYLLQIPGGSFKKRRRVFLSTRGPSLASLCSFGSHL